jgi:hypothetical protein
MLFCTFEMMDRDALAFEVTEMYFTNLSCDASDCQKAAAVSSFTDLDLGVTVWVYYRDYEENKTWKLDWYSPANVLAQPDSNTRSATTSGYSYRGIDRYTLQKHGAGRWAVNFYYDGQLVKIAYFDYTTTQTNIWHAEKIYAIPDYTQTDSSYGGFPGGGSNYCAPTSVSNSLMWLANNGFGNLAPNTSDRKKDQYDIIVGLADNMGTDPTEGTNVNQLIPGLQKYISDRGYNEFQIKYQGWRPHPQESDTGVDVPDIGWIKNGIDGTGSVWLNIGWYTYDRTRTLGYTCWIWISRESGLSCSTRSTDRLFQPFCFAE